MFAVNMVRALVVRPVVVSCAERGNPEKSVVVQACRRAGMALLMAVAVGLFVLAPLRPASASPAPAPQRADVIMIGDRLVDVAYNLGVVPAGMSVRCAIWPICGTLKAAVQVLGCPNCVVKKNAGPVVKFAKKNGIKRILIEKSVQFCSYMPKLKLENVVPLLEGQGLKIEFVDFTRGLEPAVRQTAVLLGCAGKADGLLARYGKDMEKTQKKMAGKQFVKKVVIIRGTYQAGTGKAFLRIEAPGGYADKFLLQPMGIENACYQMVDTEKRPSKGHIAIRKLDALATAAPDAIVMTGDALAVQKELAKAVKKNAALARVPAIRAMAVYSLPGYIDSSVMEYPQILRRWADVLAR